MATIAVVEDDKNIRNLIESYLQSSGYSTVGYSSAEDALFQSRTLTVELWILDVMLPGIDGFSLCRHLRNANDVPIIMVSARDDEDDRILGIEIGSDDYMTKPFSPRELVARVKRLLDRCEAWRTSNSVDQTTEHGGLKLVLEKYQVVFRSNCYDLPPKELGCLKFLAANANQACSREDIIRTVWGDVSSSDRTVDYVMRRLRKKIPGLQIDAVWGYGYRLRIH